MLRYYLIATVLVVSIVTLVTAYVNRDFIRIRLASTTLRVPPKPAAPYDGPSGANVRALRGDAPWALSALPGCLQQTGNAHGGATSVRALLPAGSIPIVAPATLVYGPCTIFVRDGEAIVRRGRDVLRIPPIAQFYRSGDRLVLLRTTDDTADLRIYRPTAISGKE